jgi:hypothetical protein
MEQLRRGAVAGGSGAGWQPSTYKVSHGVSDVAGCSDLDVNLRAAYKEGGSYD